MYRSTLARARGGWTVWGFEVRFSCCGLQVSDFVLLVSGFGYRVSGLGVRVSGFEFRVSGFRSRASGVGVSDRLGSKGGVSIPPVCFERKASAVSDLPTCIETCIRDSGFGIRVSRFSFRDSDFRIRVSGFGFRDSGFGSRGSGPGILVSRVGSQVSRFECRDADSGYQVWGFWLRVSSSGGVVRKTRTGVPRS